MCDPNRRGNQIEELDVQLVDEDCGDCECKGCGEVHDVKSLEDVMKKQRWMYRGTTAGYFISLIAFAFCSYNLLGSWGAAAAVSAFGIYFFHLNMVGLLRTLMTMEQISSKVEAAIASQAGPDESDSTPEGHGVYI